METTNARDVFGLVPRSGRELVRLVEAPPRRVAQTRIFALDPRQLEAESAGIAARALVLGRDAKDQEIAICPDGVVTVDGVRPKGLEATARAMNAAGALAPALLARTAPSKRTSTRRSVLPSRSSPLSMPSSGDGS